MAEIVAELLDERASVHGEVPALVGKRDGRWHTLTWREYRDTAHRVARGLIALGVEPGSGVAIMGYNRPEWLLADIGAIVAGGVPTGVYTNLTPEQVAYVVGHCGARVAVVENAEYLGKLLAVRHELPDLRAVVLMDGEGSGEDGVISWQGLLRAGDAVPDAELASRIAHQRPDDLCTLIYTSGTTGPPKGVMLSHRNLLWTAAAVREAFDFPAGHVVISYLPLSHSAEQMVSIYIPMTLGLTTQFAESLEKLPENLREIRPHVLFAVPRVWEKIQAAMQDAGAKNPPLKRKIAAWARGIGLAGGYAAQRGGGRPWAWPIADRLVFSKVRERLGLDRAGVCATGAAPIALDTAEFFLSLGIPIYEFYGLSETSAPATLSRIDRYRTGRAGYPIPGTEMRIAGDGEILIRGPHVFLGYYQDPEATAEVLDDDGWFSTGDVGEIDHEGFLRITDRKKEILVTSGGKNVAPAPIEAKLKGLPAVEQAVVLGDRRKYLAALLTLEPGRAAAEAEAAGSPARTPDELARCPVFHAHLERQVEQVNQTLARYETIKTFRVLPEPFTVEGGELTPTLKLKRRVITEKYGEEIDSLYA